MKDILGRVVKMDDLVVCKGTGRHSKGMRIGVQRENSVLFSNGNHTSYGELFVIKNPTEEELELKQQILKQESDALEAKKQQIAARKALTAIKKKDLQIGKIYKDDLDRYMCYLGKASYTRYKDEWNNRWCLVEEVEDDYVLIELSKHDLEKDNFEMTYSTIGRSVTTRKTLPRFIECLDTNINIDIPENGEIVFLDDREKPKSSYGYNWFNRYRYKIEIKLEDKYNV